MKKELDCWHANKSNYHTGIENIQMCYGSNIRHDTNIQLIWSFSMYIQLGWPKNHCKINARLNLSVIKTDIDFHNLNIIKSDIDFNNLNHNKDRYRLQ